MSFASFRVANHHFRVAEPSFSRSEIIIFAKQNHHFRPSGGTFPSSPKKLNIPYGGAVRLRRSLTEPFEPDTDNTGEGSKSLPKFRGCRTFNARDVRHFLYFGANIPKGKQKNEWNYSFSFQIGELFPELLFVFVIEGVGTWSKVGKCP